VSIINVAQKKDKSRLNVDSKGYLGPPPITSCTKVQEEADRVNFVDQSVISTKAGVFEAITNLVGSNITNAILYTADRSDHKRNNDYMLFKVMQAAIDGANPLATTNVLVQLLDVINHTLDFCKKVSVNMELMQNNTARMAMYGIAISVPQMTLTLLVIIEIATKAEYGCKFCSAMKLSARSTCTTTCMVQTCSRIS